MSCDAYEDLASRCHMHQSGGGSAMTFEEILDQAVAMLQRRGRVTYRALKLQFSLDEDHLEALKDELLYAYPDVVGDDGRGLVWTGEARPTATPGSLPALRPGADAAIVYPRTSHRENP